MNQAIGPEESHIREFKSQYVLPEQTNMRRVGYTTSIAAENLPSAFTTLTSTATDLNEEEIRQLLEGRSEQQASFEPVMVKKLVDAIIALRPKLEKKKGDIEDIARYVLESKDQQTGEQSDVYARPSKTNLSVPVTYLSSGQIAVSLKSKLVKDPIGSGAFKTVKSALVLSFNHKQEGKLTVEEGVSATMSAKSETDRKAIEIEKKMILRLKELGVHENIIKCLSVTAYEKKETKEAKIGLIMEFCNGGDLKDLIETTYSSDQELELIAEGILNGLAFLHKDSHNIFHSDLKPANILLNKNEYGEVIGVKITDFGCARDLNDPAQRTYFTGDRTFHSPELKLLDAKMIARIDPELKNELAAMTATKEAYDIAHVKYEDSKKIVDLKQKELDQLINVGTPEEIRQTQLELNEAIETSAQLKSVLTKTVDDHLKTETVYVNKKESLIEANRSEIYAIDESYLKSDVYAVGMILESLYKKKENHLTPEMKELIGDLMRQDPNNRLSSKQASERFQLLKTQGKILIPTPESERAFPDMPISPVKVIQEAGKGVYHIPQALKLNY